MVAGPGEDLREMIARLEQQELDCQVMRKSNCERISLLGLRFVMCFLYQTASGSVPAPLYTELLAAYLAEGELIRLVKMLYS